jgi:hypothetical protein
MALDTRQRDKARYSKRGIAESVTTHDTNNVSDLPFNIFVGTGGNLKVLTEDGQTVTLKNIANGTYIDFIKVKRIYRTDTTARDIVAIY